MQMVLVFKKSQEDTSANSFATEVGKKNGVEKKAELERKVTTLELAVKDKDLALSQLKNELAAVKVHCTNLFFAIQNGG
jgi:hypothetical protein